MRANKRACYRYSVSERRDLTERHEAQVDARINDAMHREAYFAQQEANLVKAIERGRSNGTSVMQFMRPLATAREELAAVTAERQAAEREYRGWSRAYLVTNSGGHVHRSMDCSTCYPNTSYFWVTALSGLSDDEVVDEARERACTVCYPDAPVEKLGQATRVFSDDERDAQQRAAERAAKRTAADAAKVLDPSTGRVLYKTDRAATNAIASELHDLCWYGETHPSAGEWKATIEAARRSLAYKGVEFDYDAALARARKKVTAEIKKAKADEARHSYPGQVPINVADWPKY